MLMFEQQLIDPLRFASARERLAGTIRTADLTRLGDAVLDPSGAVRYALTGEVDARGRPGLRIRVESQLVLVCQRCLERLDYRHDSESLLLVAADSTQIPDPDEDDSDADWIDGREPLDVADLVEQEIVLALPYAPAHDDVHCATEGRHGAAEQQMRNSPFSALARARAVDDGCAEIDR